MTTPGAFAFGNDHDGWSDALTTGQYRRMVEKAGHPPTWKPNHYRPRSKDADGFTSNSMRASDLRVLAQ